MKSEDNPYLDDWDKELAHTFIRPHSAQKMWEMYKMIHPIDGDMLARIRNKTV